MVTELSVVIVEYSSAEQLQACLSSLCEHTQPAGDFEVVVVVNPAVSHLHTMIDGMATPYRLRAIPRPPGNHASAANRGIEAAGGQ